MKKIFLIFFLLSLSIVGCKKKEIVEKPKKIEIKDEIEPYIKKQVTENKEKKPVSISENEIKEKKSNTPKNLPNDNKSLFKIVYISLEGYEYKCSIDKENQKITVEYKGENITGKLDLSTFERLDNLMDYIEEDRDRYKKQALLCGYPENEIDIEGWMGDVLYAFAKGTNIEDKKEKYYTHAMECLEDMEKIMISVAPQASENKLQDEPQNMSIQLPDTQNMTVINLEYNECVYVTNIQYQENTGTNIYDSSYGTYAMLDNMRAVISQNLPGSGEYTGMVDHETMINIWNYVTAGKQFPLSFTDKYMVLYTIKDDSLHIRPLAANLHGNEIELSLESSSKDLLNHPGELLILPLNDGVDSFNINKENYTQ